MKRILFVSAALLALTTAAFGDPAGSTSAALSAERDSGLLITRVLPDTPAQRAGVVRGDILVQLDNTKVTSPEQVRTILSHHSAGDVISALIIHGSTTRKISIRLEVRLYHPILGMDFSRDSVAANGAASSSSEGVYVDSVTPNGPAESAGIRAGDVVLSIDGNPVNPQDTLVQQIDSYAPGNQIQVRIKQPNGQELTLAVRLGKTGNGKPLLGLRYSSVPPHRNSLGNLLKNISPPRWFRYFGEPLFPNQLRGSKNRGTTGGPASST